MSVKDRFVDSFVEALAKRSATTVVLLSVFLVGASVAFIRLLPLLASIPLALVLVVTASFSFRLFFRRLFVIYPRRPATHEVLSKHFIYKLDVVNGSRWVTIRRFYRVRFLRDGIDMLREPYLWTGSDAARPIVVGGTCRISEPYEDTIWTVVDLHLPRAFNKGETFEYELEWRLNDTDHRSRPFLSAPTNEPTRHLKFDLYLPESPRAREVMLDQRRSIDSLTPFKSEVLPIRDGHATWDKRDPGRYFYYCLRWDYESVSSDTNQKLPHNGVHEYSKNPSH